MALSPRERALQYLARREHSRVELARKLTATGIGADELNLLLDSLQAERLLSDARYAEAYVAECAPRYGNLALIDALRQRGVDDEVISRALDCVDDEGSRAESVWRKRFSAAPANRAEAAKQARFLAGRGFSSETIAAMLKMHKNVQE